MKRFLLTIITVLGVLSITASASPIVTMTLEGSPGDYVTQGQSWQITYNQLGDQIKAVAYTQSYYGLELDTFGQQSMSLVIATGGYNTPVTVGSYVTTAGGIGSGNPFFSLGFDGRGESGTVTAFTVNAIKTADPGFVPPYVAIAYPLEYLDVSFTDTFQGAPEFKGRIIFDANPTTNPVPEPASIAFFVSAIGILGMYAKYRPG